MFQQEEYLRRARSRAIPYKQIAAHLHKTELACRLHYHQINFAHRRQSSLAVDSVRDEESLSPEWTRQGTHSRLATPSITVSYSSSPCTAYSTSPASTSTKSYTSPAMSVGTERYSPQPAQTYRSGTNNYNYGIGLTWHNASSSSPAPAPPAVPQAASDLGRLLYDYADNSRAFFSNLASQFPQSPAELEAAFRAALCQKSSSPSPQPDRVLLPPLNWPHGTSETYRQRRSTSPQDGLRSDLLAPSPKRCTVSSLLNLEKETDSQKWGVSGA
jgi:hypothetical protein